MKHKHFGTHQKKTLKTSNVIKSFKFMVVIFFGLAANVNNVTILFYSLVMAYIVNIAQRQQKGGGRVV